MDAPGRDEMPVAAASDNTTAAMPDILDATQAAIDKLRAAISKIVQEVSPSAAAFSTVLGPLAHAENEFVLNTHLLVFYKSASPDPDVRLASTQAQSLLDDFAVERAINEPLFRLVDAIVQKAEKLDPEDARYLEMKHRTHIRHGMSLPDKSQRDQLRELRAQISRDAALFRTNLANADEGMYFSPEVLDGVPDRIVSTFDEGTGENAGMLRISFRGADQAAIMRYAKDAEVRKSYLIALSNRLPENVDLFRNVVLLRDEVARLLGCSSHANLVLAERMAKTPEAAEAFHDDLEGRLLETGKAEYQVLRQLKAQDLGVSETEDLDYYLWDQSYYNRMMLEKAHQADSRRISEYFHLQVVVERMLAVFRDIFDLRFVAVKDMDSSAHSRSAVWHEDVKVFATYDDDNGGAFLGWLYMDLYARRGQKENACCYNIIPGFLYEDGSRQHPSTVLLCSFSKPSEATPCLLLHDQLVTLFHELGHAIHDLVSKTAYACFHGPMEVPVDFGEGPSQMLEYWCWTPMVLKRLSQHYSTISEEYRQSWSAAQNSTTSDHAHPDEQLPDELITSLIAAKNVHAAHFYLNQLRFSIFDQVIHNPKTHHELREMDITAVFNQIRSKIFPPLGPEALGSDFRWGHGHLVLGNHLMSEDYSAGMYGYLFSKVFAADMFDSAFRKDPMNLAEGLRYRYIVLEKGGSREPMDLLTEFLGRAPDAAAFNSAISGSG